MPIVIILLISWLLAVPLRAQGSWDVPRRSLEILLDGFLDEWQQFPPFSLAPSRPGIVREGDFEEGSLSLDLRALWDDQSLYLALDWKDDVWDIQEVLRRNAVWVTPENRRRDRMLFFDYFKFNIREAAYDFVYWISPRVNEEGPYGWHRLLEGLKGMEAATSRPPVSARQANGRVTMEILMSWEELRLKPRAGRGFPLSLLLSDSDHPGRPLEYKLRHLRWLGWEGELRLLD